MKMEGKNKMTCIDNKCGGCSGCQGTNYGTQYEEDEEKKNKYGVKQAQY